MIKPDLKPLLDILNEDYQLIVPNYQRAYNWRNNEVESIREMFEMMASSGWDEKFPDSHHKLQVRRLKPIYKGFREFLSGKNAEQLAEFQRTVHEIRIMRIEINSAEEAFSIFERTNARGLELAVADLMKNYLYQTGGKEVGVIWRDVTKNAGQSMLRMLKSFYVAHRGYIQKAELYKALREYAKDLGGGEVLAKEILDYSKFYRFAQNVGTNADSVRDYFLSADCNAVASNQDRVIEAQSALQALSLFKVKQTASIIFASLLAMKRLGISADSTSAKAFTRMLHALECFHFINTAVCSHIGNEVEHLYADLSADFGKSSNFIKSVDRVIAELRKKRASKLEFTANFTNLEYESSYAKIIYAFDRFNNFGRSPGERKVIFQPDTNDFRKSFDLEHIYAQKTAADPKRPAPTNIHNIGNLIVITKQLNGTLANKSVSEKFAELTGPSAHRTQEFPMVGALVKAFSKGADSWGDKTILERAETLADFAYSRVWSF